MQKTKFWTLLLLIITTLGFVPAKAQLSLMAGGEYVAGSQNRPAMMGFDGKLALDIKRRLQFSINGNQLTPMYWQHVQDVDLGYVKYTGSVPRKLVTNEKLKVNELSFTGTYFLLGRNVSTAGIYASIGPGMRMYKSVATDAQNSNTQVVRNATDYFLDMRAGAQLNIVIGWLYVESRFAPPLHSPSGSEGYYPHTFNPYLGFNAGLRFLLNRHPQCPI